MLYSSTGSHRSEHLAHQFSTIGLEIENLTTLRKTVIIWLGGSLICDFSMTVAIISIVRHLGPQNPAPTDVGLAAHALQEAHSVQVFEEPSRSTHHAFY